MRHLIFAAALFMPSTVWADQPSGQVIADLESCVSYSSDAPLARNVELCRDITFQACIGNTSQTTLAIENCMDRTHKAYDALLNKWWQPMKANAQAKGTWDQLLGRQRQWIKDRDAACDAAYRASGGGSIRNIDYLNCMITRTAERATEFYYTLYN
ncbi:lysozyme inhibitor LprI family protein [Actibacterium sp. 188UL27-1]|uniref:lysozyme inhibitor LprI family protein n=1 Tax=Actibacterium sp. 188UL27-1 TaxID=2786961 RepID=UPI00195B0403|nr:lysozyme inhibitor LprI family protein [Actibacterium sp. 188UL27-1]MBM7067782.1 DUF1311 domain-containing protein [Actibacterium sp. 188UL27-1]